MDLTRLTIGQMAKLNNVSKQTLRLYDKEGLLHPMTKDNDTGYRYYNIIQSARLDMIQYMKNSKMTLKQIQSVLTSHNKSKIQTVLREQRVSIDAEMKRLKASKRAIDKTLDNYEKYELLPPNGTVFLEYIPQRLIYHYKCDINFFDQNYIDYEYILRELKQHLTNEEMAISYFCNVGTITRQKKLSIGEYFSNEIFMFVDEEDMATESLPQAMYLCICTDNFYEEKDSAQKLVSYIEEEGYSIAGDYVCEVLIDFPAFDKAQRHMYLKIQIPVIPPK